MRKKFVLQLRRKILFANVRVRVCSHPYYNKKMMGEESATQNYGQTQNQEGHASLYSERQLCFNLVQ